MSRYSRRDYDYYDRYNSSRRHGPVSGFEFWFLLIGLLAFFGTCAYNLLHWLFS